MNVDPPVVDRYDREKKLEAQYRAHGCHAGWIYPENGGEGVLPCPKCVAARSTIK
jgi:hypothetical protein